MNSVSHSHTHSLTYLLTKVGHVTAEDRDGLPQNNAFVYAFDGGSTSTNEFSIDPHTGLIVTRRPLDREVRQRQRFQPPPTKLPVTCLLAPHHGWHRYRTKKRSSRADFVRVFGCSCASLISA